MSVAVASSSDSVASPAHSRDWLAPLAILAVAVLIGHAPLAGLHLRSLWLKEQYQYFPFVIGAVAWLLWSRWQVARKEPPNSVRWHKLPWAIVASSLVLLTGSIVLASPWLAFVSLNIAMSAIFVWLARQRQIAYLWGIWLLLWLMVPLPLGIDDRVVRVLQRLSSQLSSTILDVGGILHYMAGNVLTLPDKELFVDEACSGIVSVMSIIACAMIYAVWRNRSLPHLVLLTLAGMFWAVVLNVSRICIIAAAHHNYGFDLTSGTPHELLGLALFTITFLALISTDYLLLFLFAPIDAAETIEEWKKNRLVRLWNWVFGPNLNEPSEAPQSDTAGDCDGGQEFRPPVSRVVPIAAAFVVLGVVQLAWLPTTNTAKAREAVEHALDLTDAFLPPQIGPWNLESYNFVEREARNEFGRYSQIYQYRHTNRNEVAANVSLDFPYLGGWHDLCVCYRNNGWTIHDRVLKIDEGSQSGMEWSYVEGMLAEPTGETALVVFAGFDVEGHAAEPSSAAVLYRPWFRLRRRLLHNLAAQLFQVQVFATGNSFEDAALKDDVRLLLFAARERFRHYVVGADGPRNIVVNAASAAGDSEVVASQSIEEAGNQMRTRFLQANVAAPTRSNRHSPAVTWPISETRY